MDTIGRVTFTAYEEAPLNVGFLNILKIKITKWYVLICLMSA